mgnify:FL=1
MKLFQTIRGRMMLAYTGLVLLLIIIFSALYYKHASSLMLENASSSLLQLAVNTNSSLDYKIENLDSVIYRIASSALVKEEFYKPAKTTSEILNNNRSLMDLLFTVTGSQIENPINIIGKNGKFVDFGSDFSTSYLDSATQEEVNQNMSDCLARKGAMHISARPFAPSDSAGSAIFSICRAFNETFSGPYDACVEILFYYDDIKEMMTSVSGNDYTAFHVYDASGNLLYPSVENSPDYYAQVKEDSALSGTFSFEDGQRKEVVSFSRSEYSGITLFASQNEDYLYTPVNHFRSILLYVSVFILLFTVLLIYLLASQLTKPIRSLQTSISNLDLNALEDISLPQKKYSARELEALRTAYIRMIDRLKASLDETVTARSHEIESRMLALQAQMNPHFLYNTITIISIRAEDYGADDIVMMCETLSSMLRYITKDTYGKVSLGKEFKHLEEYLFLMECRYPKQFSAKIDVPDEMMQLTVPKFIIQPLVENSFKHGFQTQEHWIIRINGHMEGNTWEITVADNGIGFSESTLHELENDFTPVHEGSNEEEHGNLGLSNILHRLRFLYKDKAVFRISNDPAGGCHITIGGICYSADRPYNISTGEEK